MLEEDVIAYGVDEGAQASGLTQGAGLAKSRDDPREGFLAHVLNRLRGLEPRAKLQMEQFGEVANEVLLSAAIPSAKTFDVLCIELVKLQGIPRRA